MIQRYPLQWPVGWRRTSTGQRRHAQFKRVEKVTTGYGVGTKNKRLSIAEAMQRVFAELERLGVKHVQEDVVISTNLRVNMSGMPRGDQGEPSDPGVAVYWELKGVRQCMAIDQYWRVADNMAAIAASLEAMRAIERHGGAEILERTFRGFTALPQTTGRSWREVLNFTTSDNPPLEVIESRYRDLARSRHPDAGGSVSAMQELNRAREEARAELGRRA